MPTSPQHYGYMYLPSTQVAVVTVAADAPCVCRKLLSVCKPLRHASGSRQRQVKLPISPVHVGKAVRQSSPNSSPSSMSCFSLTSLHASIEFSDVPLTSPPDSPMALFLVRRPGCVRHPGRCDAPFPASSPCLPGSRIATRCRFSRLNAGSCDPFLSCIEFRDGRLRYG
ncbi:hypothetical protein N658DRAFT_25733 [Parathielavia hyrcaniae]|uniref:Uncharacterized protein n=1 Tax=Parathielavia hyrcaniae TaxID=113614 RepID=A0AAN6T6J2_9PEZI|nr:hypothetical protein N658DRAFT_25733 [Parathielavia hyrcaniae]